MSKCVALPRANVGAKGRVSRRDAFSTAVIVASLLAAGFGGAFAQTATPTVGKAAEIHIDNFAFSPAELTISVGTTVTWTNRDDIPHTVTEKAIAFRSKAMDTDEQFSHTFDAPGEVDYFCSLHPHMTGKIIVKP